MIKGLLFCLENLFSESYKVKQMKTKVGVHLISQLLLEENAETGMCLKAYRSAHL